jgi:hypothetical protein
MVTQDSRGAGGAAEAGDRYGAAIDVFGAFTTEPIVVVAIGVPGEDVGRAKNAGALAYASFDLNLTPEEGSIRSTAGSHPDPELARDSRIGGDRRRLRLGRDQRSVRA